MDEEVKILKEQVIFLKEKLRKKSEKLKKANKSIKDLTRKFEKRISFYRARNTEIDILRDLVANHDKFTYEVTFKYKDKIYTEPKVESFGSKWLRQSLMYHYAWEKEIILSSYDLEIVSAKKLW